MDFQVYATKSAIEGSTGIIRRAED